MKPTGIASHLPDRLPPGGNELSFPRLRRRELKRLRDLRDRLLREGKAGQALRIAERIAERNPGRESYFRLGVVQREAGRLRDSLKTFRDALRFESGPRYLLPEIHLQTAMSWMNLGEMKRMGEALRRGMALRPSPRSEGMFRHSLGNFHFSQGRYHQAIREYEAAAAVYARATSRAAVLSNIGLSLEKLGRFDDAASRLKTAIRILKRSGAKGKLGSTRQVLSTLYFNQGKFRRSLGMFLRAARTFHEAGLRDREVTALCNAAWAAGKAGDWGMALSLGDRAISQAAETGQWQDAIIAYALRSISHACTGDFRKAELDLKRACGLLRGRRYANGRLHVLGAQVQLARLRGDWREVSRLALKAERLNGKEGYAARVAEYREIRAEAERKRGRDRTALFAEKAASRLRLRRALLRTSDLQKVVPRLALANIPLLILGENGMVRGEVARTVHTLSPRSKGPCVLVPCEQLRFVEAELCGWRMGAWSGSVGDGLGFARRARGGTLILDRVDALSARDQRVLVRVVEGRIRPVGQAGEERVDLRFIATCERVDGLIPELRARLSGAVLRAPAVREERSVRALVDTVLAGRRRITPDALALIVAQASGSADLHSPIEQMVRESRSVIGIRHVQRCFRTPDLKRHRARVHTSRNLRQNAPALA